MVRKLLAELYPKWLLARLQPPVIEAPGIWKTLLVRSLPIIFSVSIFAVLLIPLVFFRRFSNKSCLVGRAAALHLFSYQRQDTRFVA